MQVTHPLFPPENHISLYLADNFRRRSNSEYGQDFWHQKAHLREDLGIPDVKIEAESSRCGMLLENFQNSRSTDMNTKQECLDIELPVIGGSFSCTDAQISVYATADCYGSTDPTEGDHQNLCSNHPGGVCTANQARPDPIWMEPKQVSFHPCKLKKQKDKVSLTDLTPIVFQIIWREGSKQKSVSVTEITNDPLIVDQNLQSSFVARRIYDVLNVLEAVGAIRRCGRHYSKQNYTSYELAFQYFGDGTDCCKHSLGFSDSKQSSSESEEELMIQPNYVHYYNLMGMMFETKHNLRLKTRLYETLQKQLAALSELISANKAREEYASSDCDFAGIIRFPFFGLKSKTSKIYFARDRQAVGTPPGRRANSRPRQDLHRLVLGSARSMQILDMSALMMEVVIARTDSPADQDSSAEQDSSEVHASMANNYGS